MTRLLHKSFRNFAGVSFSVPELIRDATYATDSVNARLSENKALTKRRGSQIDTKVDCAGSVTFNDTDIATGTQTQKRFILNDTLRELELKELTLMYAGLSTGQAEFILDVNTSTFKLNLYEDQILIASHDCGTGKEAIPVTVDNLISSVAAPFSLTLSGSSSAPAAFIDVFQLTSVTTSLNAYFRQPVAVSTPTGYTAPFSSYWAQRTSDTFENMSTLQKHNVLYITNGVDGLHKYDGTRLYKAGLPIATKPASASENISADPAHIYIAVYEYTDAKGNLIFSSPSNELITDATVSPKTVTVDVSNLETGYDIDGNLQISLYRTSENGTIFYLVETKDYLDNVSSVVTFTDSLSDTTLSGNAQYTAPTRNPDPPPICRYIDVWRNQIVLTGNPNDVNQVYIADIESLEGFDFRNSVPTSSRLGHANSGIKSLDNFLYVFTSSSVSVITGDISNVSTLQVDTVDDSGIGALSHASIIEANRSLYFIARDGIYSVNSSGVRPISQNLDALFYNYDFTQIRCTSFYWPNERKLIFHLPRTILGDNVVTESKTFSYDLTTEAWLPWANLDLICGLNLDQQNVWFASTNSVSSFLFTRTKLDYADHEEPINFIYKANWETLGEPSVPKKFLRLKVYTIDTEFQTFESTDFTLKCSTEHDYLNEPVSTFDLDFGGSSGGWGVFPWGVTAWGEVKESVRASRLAAKRAQSLRVIFENSTVHENVLISGYELEIAPMFDSFIKDK